MDQYGNTSIRTHTCTCTHMHMHTNTQNTKCIHIIHTHTHTHTLTNTQGRTHFLILLVAADLQAHIVWLGTVSRTSFSSPGRILPSPQNSSYSCGTTSGSRRRAHGSRVSPRQGLLQRKVINFQFLPTFSHVSSDSAAAAHLLQTREVLD
jgi:hypothetical protein